MADEAPAVTYHLDLWTDPAPSYVCALCVHEFPTLRFVTVEDVTTHLTDVHAAAAVPTPEMADLFVLREDSDARRAAANPPSPLVIS
jgi:hypothetical protein